MARSLGQDECREAAKDDALWRVEEEEAMPWDQEEVERFGVT